MKIEYLYTPNVISCRPSDTLAHAARLLRQADVGTLPVLRDDGTLAGIVSERDIVRAMSERRDASTAMVRTYASLTVEVAEPDDDSWVIGRRMLDAGIRHLPVLAEGRVAGMLSIRDVFAVETWA